MAVYINTLNGGNITIGAGGGGFSGHAETRVTYTAESGHADWSHEIAGELTNESIPNIEDVKTIDIGTSVTKIGNQAFEGCESLTSIIIPPTTDMGEEIFSWCYDLTSITFEARNKATVQSMNTYPFGLEISNYDGVTIHCTDGDIQIQHY